MADLGSKSTDGRLSFVKYVTENPRFSEIDYEIEKGKKTPVYTKKGTGFAASTKTLTEGTKLKITDKKMYELAGMKLALITNIS